MPSTTSSRLTAAIAAPTTGATAGRGSSSSSRIPPARPWSPSTSTAPSSGRAVGDGQRAGRLDRDDLGRPPTGVARASAGADRGRASTRPKTPAVGRSSSSPPRPAGRCTSGSGFAVQTWIVIDRGARGLPATARRSTDAADPVRSSRTTSATMARIDARATGEDRAAPPAGVRARTGRPAVLDATTAGLSAGSWSGRRGAAARRSPRTPRTHAGPARRAPARRRGRTRRVRAGVLLDERVGLGQLSDAGLDRGLASAAPGPGRPARLAARGDLGAVQPRPRVRLGRRRRRHHD